MKNNRSYGRVAVRLLASLLMTVLTVVIGVKLLGFFMPFAVGWLIAAIATPLVNWLEKRLKIVKRLGSVLLVVIVLGLVVAGLYFLISGIITEMIHLAKDFPEIYAQLEIGLRQIGDSLSGLFERLPADVQVSWNVAIANLDQYVGEVVSKVSEPTVEAAGNFAKRVPYYLITIAMSVMSAYFFIVQRDEVLQWMKDVTPQAIQKRMTLVMDNLKCAVGGYFRAQLKIMGVVFVILLAGLGFLHTAYFGLVAFLISFLDFLPFFGTGTAMIPWAVYELFTGHYKRAAALVLIYVITQVVRQLLQPKMVGDSVGLNPLITLILLYIGYRMSGVIGMIIAVPVGIVLINITKAGAFDYIVDDVKILIEGVLGMHEDDER